MKKIVERYKAAHSAQFYKSLVVSILLLLASLVFNYGANIYTASHVSAGPGIRDIILDRLPVVNVDDIVFEGAVMFIAFTVFLALHKPLRIPLMFKSGALFITVRAFFIILTHIAPPLRESYVPVNNALERLIAGSGDDLFFSGHAGFPFLMALLFWHKYPLRTTFLVISVIFAAAVLLGHLHYSIDVFAAYFITYGIYHLSRRLFKQDFTLFRET